MAIVNGLKLLGVGNNAKTIKGDGSEYLTAIMYLLPDDFLCPMARLAGCKAGCLNTAGRGAFNHVQAARHRKSKLLLQLPEEFSTLLREDLDKFQKYCERKGIEVESAGKLISKPLKEKIRYQATELNYLKKTSRGKLPL